MVLSRLAAATAMHARPRRTDTHHTRILLGATFLIELAGMAQCGHGSAQPWPVVATSDASVVVCVRGIAISRDRAMCVAPSPGCACQAVHSRELDE
jgi:hypothetical protein